MKEDQRDRPRDKRNASTRPLWMDAFAVYLYIICWSIAGMVFVMMMMMMTRLYVYDVLYIFGEVRSLRLKSSPLTRGRIVNTDQAEVFIFPLPNNNNTTDTTVSSITHSHTPSWAQYPCRRSSSSCCCDKLLTIQKRP